MNEQHNENVQKKKTIPINYIKFYDQDKHDDEVGMSGVRLCAGVELIVDVGQKNQHIVSLQWRKWAMCCSAK